MSDTIRKLLAAGWESFFRKAGVRVEDLNASKSNRTRAIKIGQFLSPHVNREVPVQVKGRTGKAVLRAEEGRAKEKRYFFVVTWDDEPTASTPVHDNSHTVAKPTPAEKRTPGPKRKSRRGKKVKKPRAGVPAPDKPAAKGTAADKNNEAGNSEDW
jgi:hypothetical protein